MLRDTCHVAVRQHLPNRSRGRATLHGRVLTPRPFFRGANTGAGQDLTGLAAVVQLRLRVAIPFGLQTLLVKSRLLTGENTVQFRGDPPILTRSAECGIIILLHLSSQTNSAFRVPRLPRSHFEERNDRLKNSGKAGRA